MAGERLLPLDTTTYEEAFSGGAGLDSAVSDSDSDSDI